MGIKHVPIEQIDECGEDLDTDKDSEEHKSSLHYQKIRGLGGGYQSFIDFMEVIKASDLDPNYMGKEKTKVLEARKEALKLKN